MGSISASVISLKQSDWKKTIRKQKIIEKISIFKVIPSIWRFFVLR